MTKEKIIKDLKERIQRNQYCADLLMKKDCKEKRLAAENNNWTYYAAKIEAYKQALLLVEAMHNDEYWNEAIADAIAMGDR